MRYALLLLLLLHATSGMAAEPIAIDMAFAEERDGITYQVGSDQPFTGIVTTTFASGMRNSEVSYTNGLKDGPSTTWYENGHMRLKSAYKEGARDGQWISWDQDGHVLFQKQYVNGRLRRF